MPGSYRSQPGPTLEILVCPRSWSSSQPFPENLPGSPRQSRKASYRRPSLSSTVARVAGPAAGLTPVFTGVTDMAVAGGVIIVGHFVFDAIPPV